MNIELLKTLRLLNLCYIDAIANEASPEEFIELLIEELKARREEEKLKNKVFNPDEVVSDIWGVEANKLPQKTRKREIVEARQVCMWLRATNTKDSLSTIGSRYNRDHATVLHAKKTVYNLIETDKTFRERVELAKSKLEK